MKWLTAALDLNNFFWPTRETTIAYRGRDYLLRPQTDSSAPSVSLNAPDLDYEQQAEAINRFLSALSWTCGGGISVMCTTGSGGQKPINVGKANTKLVSDHFRPDYLPEPTTERAHRALALYREALTLENIPYRFLGFYKVLNIIHAAGAEQMAWINRVLPHVSDYEAKQRLAILNRTEPDIGNYLYVSGRCAVSHAFNHPTVDPDLPQAIQRLRQDMPVIKALAEYAIEAELGIMSRSTFHHEHRYELAGFADILGQDIIARILAGQTVDVFPPFPNLSVRLRDQPPFEAFEDMRVQKVAQSKSTVLLLLESQDALCKIELHLDFAAWRLLLDSEKWVLILDDDPQTAKPLYYCRDHTHFLKGHLLNGQVEVYAMPDNRLLGRTDPFIPMNLDMRSTVKNLDEISSRYIEEAKAREKRKTNNGSDRTGDPDVGHTYERK